MNKRLRLMVYGNAIVAVFVAMYFFVIPVGILVRALTDPGLRTGTVPRFAYRWHRSLSKQFESWARSRVISVRAIEAVTALVADPNHAMWVKAQWGDNYLQHEDLFYRMLLVSGLTSYQKLMGDKTYQALLSGQVEALVSEFDTSPFGLLDDYPGSCYPVDVLPAIAAIRKADAVLGTDHAEFATGTCVKRSTRGNFIPNTPYLSAIRVRQSGIGSGIKS